MNPADRTAAITAARIGSVFIVEDDGLIAMTIEDAVREFGARQVHIHSNHDHAIHAAREENIDCAILDVLLGNVETYQIADILAERGIPFTFCTGFTRDEIAERHRHRPVIDKLYRDQDLHAWLSTIWGSSHRF